MIRTKTFPGAAVFAAIALSLTACDVSSADGTETPESYIDSLEYNTYYIRHADESCEVPYWGLATFDQGNTTSGSDNSRILWFTDETFAEIPTLYEGDSLIYLTEDELDESFNFERFEDLGYSIGLRGFTKTKSGRYSISTNADDMNTFPDGDTDVLLELTNGTVIIDKLSGNELRAPQEQANGVEVGSILTRCDTLLNLKKGATYETEVYEGTVLHTYKFTADKRLLGSMDVTETTDYEFESEKLMRIEIPDNFNSGYYMINGMGLFRYVNGTSYNDDTNFNVPNVKETEEETTTSSTTYYTPSYDVTDTESGDNNASNSDPREEDEDLTEAVFTITESGQIHVYVSFTGIEEGQTIKGYLVEPDGTAYAMTDAGASIEVYIYADPGDYTVQLYDVGAAEAEISVVYVN